MDNIYKSPESNIEIDNVEVGEYAGFWIRVLATVIDGVWILLLSFVLGWLVYGDVYLESDAFYLGVADFFISEVVPFLITIVFWVYYAATPGKMVLGLKIVDADTFEKVTVGRFIIRYIGYFFSYVVLFLGVLWICWDDRKQGWHDKMARTVVVKTR